MTSSHHAQRLLLAAAMTRVLARRVPGFDLDDALENIEDLALTGIRGEAPDHRAPTVLVSLDTLTQLAERCATIAALPAATGHDPALAEACRSIVDLLVEEIESRHSEILLTDL